MNEITNRIFDWNKVRQCLRFGVSNTNDAVHERADSRTRHTNKLAAERMAPIEDASIEPGDCSRILNRGASHKRGGAPGSTHCDSPRNRNKKTVPSVSEASKKVQARRNETKKII